MTIQLELDRVPGAAKRLCGLACGLLLVGWIAAGGAHAGTAPAATAAAPPLWRPAPDAPLVLAQADEGGEEAGEMESDEAPRGGKLEPRYKPREYGPEPWYNASYIFGITRTIANSTMVPAAKVPLFVLSIPLDIVFLPFAAIGGLFG